MRPSWIVVAFTMGMVGIGCGGPAPERPAPVAPPAPVDSCANDRSFRCQVGPQAYDAWASAIRDTDPKILASADVDGTIQALAAIAPDEYAKRNFKPLATADLGAFAKMVDDGPSEIVDPSSRRDPPWARYYTVDVTHERMKTNEWPERSMGFEFVGHLPLVRIPLPRRSDPRVKAYQTKIGEVRLDDSLRSQGMSHGNTRLQDGKGPCPRSADHWYATIEELVEDWHLERANVTRVDLVTTARAGHFRGPARFAAIGFYLVYEGGHSTPSTYVIEAGEALDFARQVFKGDAFSEGTKEAPIGPPTAQGTSTYNPTRLSDPENLYKAWLGIRPAALGAPPMGNVEWDPSWLTITSTRRFQGTLAPSPYISVRAELHESGAPHPGLNRLQLTCMAGGRVRDIEDTFGGIGAIGPGDRRLLRAAFRALCDKKYLRTEHVEPPTEAGANHMKLPPSFNDCGK